MNGAILNLRADLALTMTLPTAVAVRLATEGDSPAICALLGAAFADNPKADPEVLAWQYTDNPFGRPMSWVAEAEASGDIVGHAGLYVTPGRIHGEPCLIGHAGDAATHPEWRGRGLYEELSRQRFSYAASHGLAATICIPNSGSREAAVRSGLHLRHHLRGFVRPRGLQRRGPGQPWRGPSRLGRVDLLASSGVVEMDRPSADWDVDELASVHDPQRHGIRRSAAWLRWRYADHPTRTFRFLQQVDDDGLQAIAVTSAVIRDGRRYTYVMDVMGRTPGRASEILRMVAGAEEESSATIVLAAPGSASARAAVRAGYVPLPHRLDPQPQHLGLATGSLGMDGRWEASWGDHDHL